jgi:hypothetical protein
VRTRSTLARWVGEPGLQVDHLLAHVLAGQLPRLLVTERAQVGQRGVEAVGRDAQLHAGRAVPARATAVLRLHPATGVPGDAGRGLRRLVHVVDPDVQVGGADQGGAGGDPQVGDGAGTLSPAAARGRLPAVRVGIREASVRPGAGAVACRRTSGAAGRLGRRVAAAARAAGEQHRAEQHAGQDLGHVHGDLRDVSGLMDRW